jgi:FkbM family methyltransferase
MANVVLLFFFDFIFLFGSKYPFSRKLRVLATYLKIAFKFLILHKLFGYNPKSEDIFGFTVYFSNYLEFYLLFKEIFVRGEYYFEALNSHPTILDCGANVGMAMIFFKFLYPHCKIIAFEPGKRPFELLKRNVESNDLKRVMLINKALSGKRGKIDFFIFNSKTSSVVNRIGDVSDAEKKDFIKTTVDSVILSDYITERVDFAKMDIEGAEHEVVEELAKRRKLQNIKEIIFEYHHHFSGKRSRLSHFLSFLEQNGFDYLINSTLYRGYQKGKAQNVMIFAYQRKN